MQTVGWTGSIRYWLVPAAWEKMQEWAAAQSQGACASEAVVSILVDGNHSMEARRLVGATGSRCSCASNHRSLAPRGELIAKAGNMQFTLSLVRVELQDQPVAIRHGRGEMGSTTVHLVTSCGCGTCKASKKQGLLYWVSTQEAAVGSTRDG